MRPANQLVAPRRLALAGLYGLFLAAPSALAALSEGNPKDRRSTAMNHASREGHR
jgi:hypothetical protein